MARVKRGNVLRKKHKKILKLAKGFRGKLSKVYRQAKPAVFHALSYAYRDRKCKKREFRKLWIARLNAAVRPFGISYSKFIAQLSSKNVQLNRKVLSEIAYHEPAAFEGIVKFIGNKQ